MNRKLFLAVLPILGIASVMFFSSFFNPIEKDEPNPNPEIKYRGTSKKTTKNGPIRLSTGFQNDYFTNQRNQGFFYVEIEADAYRNSNYNRPPMNLSIVIDRSGSMSGEKIRNAKIAAKHIVDNLDAQDYLSIVVYDQHVSTLHHQARVKNKLAIKQKIDGIQHRGSTNLMGGAMKGYEQVNKYYRSGYINRVLLLSDGLANEGITDPKQIRNIVQGKFREQNIAISTFGVGTDYNEDLLTAMAENGSGNYYFIEKPNEIAGIFKKELNGLMEVVAQNSILTITVPNSVRVEKVIGYAHTQRGNKVSIKLNDIFSQETKGILVKYRINNSNMPNSISFGTSLNCRLASNERNQTLALRNIQNYTNSATVYNENFSEWVEAQVVLNQANYKMEMAMQAIDRGDYTKGRAMVKETNKYFNDNSQVVESSEELQRAFRGNVYYSNEIKDFEKRSESDKKYIQKSNKSTNYKIRRKK